MLITSPYQNKCFLRVKEGGAERRKNETQKEEADREYSVCVPHNNYVKAGGCSLHHPSLKSPITIASETKRHRVSLKQTGRATEGEREKQQEKKKKGHGEKIPRAQVIQR